MTVNVSSNAQRFAGYNPTNDSGKIAEINSLMREYGIPQEERSILSEYKAKTYVVVNNTFDMTERLGNRTSYEVAKEKAVLIAKFASALTPGGEVSFYKICPTRQDVNSGANSGITIKATEEGLSVLHRFLNAGLNQEVTATKSMDVTSYDLMKKIKTNPDWHQQRHHIVHITNEICSPNRIVHGKETHARIGMDGYKEFIEQVFENPDNQRRFAITHHIVTKDPRIVKLYNELQSFQRPVVVEGKSIVRKVGLVLLQEEEATRNPIFQDKGLYTVKEVLGATNLSFGREEARLAASTTRPNASVPRGSQGGCCTIM